MIDEQRKFAEKTASKDFIIAVANAMKAEMHKRGISHSELADMLGVSRPRVTVILNGERPLTLAMISRISRAIGSSPRIAFD